MDQFRVDVLELGEGQVGEGTGRDGAPAEGAAPVSKDGIAPGEHILEASANGYQLLQQPVTVESGRQQVVSLRLERDAREAGDIIVRTSVGCFLRDVFFFGVAQRRATVLRSTWCTTSDVVR